MKSTRRLIALVVVDVGRTELKADENGINIPRATAANCCLVVRDSK